MDISDAILSDKPEFTLTRTFDAPRNLVYRIWTEPEYVKQWWGVDDSRIVRCELDVRPGGHFRIDMRTADGDVYVNRGTYLDVVANELLVTKDLRESDATGESLPIGTHTITFQERSGMTLVTLTSQFEHIEDRDLMVRYGMVNGIRQSLNRLERLFLTKLKESC